MWRANSPVVSDDADAAADDDDDLTLRSLSLIPEYFLHRGSLAVYRFQRLGLFLLPSFIARGGAPADGEKAGAVKSRDTDFLDGLRGVASFIVVIHHLTRDPYQASQFGFGSSEDNWHVLQLPFLRLIYEGGAMVAIFFVVSGFALTSKGVQLIRSQSPSAFKVLASSTFRRSVRLFLPSVAVTFMAFLLQRMGRLKDHTKKHPVETTLAAETVLYLAFLKGMLNVYTWDEYYGFYNPHLWTIAVEFRCSMIVFLGLLGLSRTRTAVRIGTETLMLFHAAWNDRWEVMAFIGGLLIAEEFYHRKENAAAGYTLLARDVCLEKDVRFASPANTKCPRTKTLLYSVLLVFGLFLASFPHHLGCESIGFSWVCELDWHPEHKQWHWTSTYAAMLIVLSISNLPAVQQVFTTPVASYLGKISYALYLTHGILLRAFVAPVQKKLIKLASTGPEIGFHMAIFSSGILLLLVAIPCADLVWRAVDAPSVDLARWLETKCAYEEKPVHRV
ncbi:hypothetical protein QTJ16_001603 [Diplocarpon rosae]|uniref:Acyltransferase 3 domain-containing protein n=1 Tax=Diplocarpon rosae TaxID=946125 RepID=A0AAD9WEL3_9HELO|nr:hypothetical protein QTJ16_001603 [Diplocarpon rosae]